MELFIVILYATIQACIPLLLAGLGELVCEKSGVLNLGIEGMMLMGAVTAFVVAVESDSLFLGFVMAIFAGTLMSACFAFLTLVLRANQVASGLALSIFGVGLSAFIGLEYVGKPLQGLENFFISYLSEIPLIGRVLFQHDIIVYLSFGLFFAVHRFLYHSRLGLVVRATGENHDAAHMMGYSVIKIRVLAVLFGGMMAGLAGAYLTLVYTPLWSENMTAGRGWIALALVVFAAWRPFRLLVGALLFGFVSITQLFLQSNQGFLSAVPTELFTSLPYLTTIVVLVVISVAQRRKNLSVPSNLGQVFEPR
jgi:simple sugar transport system permease protein